MTTDITAAATDPTERDAVAQPSDPSLDRESLGARLRELRLESGMSLRALARELGISPSAVSQIERGGRQPSVGRLIAIVAALGVPLASVFDGEAEATPATAVEESDRSEPEPYALARAGDSRPVVLESGVIFRRLSPRPNTDLEFFESTYPPEATSTAHRRFHRHDGYEVGTVTAGRLTIEFETDVVTLGVGDSITFPCERPHAISNRSRDEVAVATWLIVHR